MTQPGRTSVSEHPVRHCRAVSAGLKGMMGDGRVRGHIKHRFGAVVQVRRKGRIEDYYVFGNPDTFEDSLLASKVKLDAIQRDREHLEQSNQWRPLYMQGGAGEGKQYLLPSGLMSNKEAIKTDAVLPAFCDPPNPCPPGMTAEDGCLEDFENTAEFSRIYQANQNCLCDEDHMFSCPLYHYRASEQFKSDSNGFDDAMKKLLNVFNIQGEHKGLEAKKFHIKRRARRSAGYGYSHSNLATIKDKIMNNPYLHGERLKVIAKKGTHAS
uniref:Neuroendocrine protein 7B2 n=1 Tax=Trichuris muris TaxID=70415 RepID=A0A5S6Q1A0_TRIMR